MHTLKHHRKGDNNHGDDDARVQRVAESKKVAETKKIVISKLQRVFKNISLNPTIYVKDEGIAAPEVGRKSSAAVKSIL